MKAKDIFYKKQNTKEFLDDRKITFGENDMIYNVGKIVADSLFDDYGGELTIKKIEEYINKQFNDNDFSKYLLDYVTEILEKNYDLSLNKIKI